MLVCHCHIVGKTVCAPDTGGAPEPRNCPLEFSLITGMYLNLHNALVPGSHKCLALLELLGYPGCFLSPRLPSSCHQELKDRKAPHMSLCES